MDRREVPKKPEMLEVKSTPSTLSFIMRKPGEVENFHSYKVFRKKKGEQKLNFTKKEKKTENQLVLGLLLNLQSNT